MFREFGPCPPETGGDNEMQPTVNRERLWNAFMEIGRIGDPQSQSSGMLPWRGWAVERAAYRGRFQRSRCQSRRGPGQLRHPQRRSGGVTEGNGTFRLHDHKFLAPAEPHAGQHRPKQAVGHAEEGPGRFSLYDSQLLAQGKVFRMQRRAAKESLTGHGKDDLSCRLHVGDALRRRP